MTTPKHTPTPWLWSADGRHLMTEADVPHADVVLLRLHPMFQMTDADREHIVRCVNAHDELVAALEAAEAELDLLRRKDDVTPYNPTLRAVVSAALAKARGGA